MPIPMHVLLLKGPARSRAAQLPESVIIAGCPLRGCDRPPVNPPDCGLRQAGPLRRPAKAQLKMPGKIIVSVGS